MARQEQLVEEYARMWPREVFDRLIPNQDGKKKGTKLAKGLELLNKPGVYVLYRNDIPYYIDRPLRSVVGYGTTPPTPVRGITIFGISFARSWFPTRDDGMKLRAFSSPPCRQPTARNQKSKRRKCRRLWYKWRLTSDEQKRILNS